MKACKKIKKLLSENSQALYVTLKNKESHRIFEGNTVEGKTFLESYNNRIDLDDVDYFYNGHGTKVVLN